MKARVGIIAIGQSAFFIGVTGQEVFMNGLSQQQELGASSGRWGRMNNCGQNRVRPEPELLSWACALAPHAGPLAAFLPAQLNGCAHLEHAPFLDISRYMRLQISCP